MREATNMVRAESEKQFHKKKALDALERVKDAVDNDDLEGISRQHNAASYHVDEVQRLLSDTKGGE